MQKAADLHKTNRMRQTTNTNVFSLMEDSKLAALNESAIEHTHQTGQNHSMQQDLKGFVNNTNDSLNNSSIESVVESRSDDEESRDGPRKEWSPERINYGHVTIDDTF